jgi:hypothetical protein
MRAHEQIFVPFALLASVTALVNRGREWPVRLGTGLTSSGLALYPEVMARFWEMEFGATHQASTAK